MMLVTMGWASNHTRLLKSGQTVEIRPRGNSMEPRIKSGDTCVIRPIQHGEELEVDNIVLCKVKGREYLHKIHAIDRGRYLIGNNKGHVNGWISINSIFGKLETTT